MALNITVPSVKKLEPNDCNCEAIALHSRHCNVWLKYDPERGWIDQKRWYKIREKDISKNIAPKDIAPKDIEKGSNFLLKIFYKLINICRGIKS